MFDRRIFPRRPWSNASRWCWPVFAAAFAIAADLAAAPKLAPAPAAAPKLAPAPAAPPLVTDALSIVKAADRGRGGGLQSGVTMESTVTSFEGGKARRSYTMQIESADGNSLVTFVKPATSRGTRMLIKKRNMWFISTDVKRPVPISPRQRLLGEAANGDLAMTNFSDDYDPRLVGDTVLDGTPCYVIELKAKPARGDEGQASYDRAKYYVSKDKQLGIKAEYFTLSGQMLKTAKFEYGNQLSFEGRQQPFVSRTEIRDTHNPSKMTVLEYASPKVTTIPSTRFQIQSLLSQ